VKRATEKIFQRPVREAGAKLRLDDRVFVRDGKKAMFLEVGSILLLESEGNYTKILSPQGHVLLRRPIKYFEDRLAPEDFLRANRAQMVNLHHVKSWEPLGEGKLKAVLDSGVEVEISRRQARAFQERSRL